MTSLIIVIFLLVAGKFVTAAELVHSDDALCDYRLLGEINVGDTTKLQDLPNSLNPVRLCLDGNGGSLAEALRIFDLIWEQNVHTVVLPGESCWSACAIIFMAGGDVQGTDLTRQISRTIFPTSSLKFHSPRLSSSVLKRPTSGAITETYNSSLNIISGLFNLSQKFEKGVSPFPEFTFGRIVGTPYQEWYEVATVGDAVINELQLDGFIVSGQFSRENFRNICRNVLAKDRDRLGFHTVGESSGDRYRGINFYDDVAEERTAIWTRDSFYDEVQDFVEVGPIYSGSKYGYLSCLIRITDARPQSEHAYPSPYDRRIFVHYGFVHNNDSEGLLAVREELSYLAVPYWYKYNPETPLADLTGEITTFRRVRCSYGWQDQCWE